MLPHAYIRALAAIAPLALVTGACTEIINPNCADRGHLDEYAGTSAVLDIRDAEGRPAALGTTVRLTGSGVDESVTGRLPGDSILAIGRDPGRFTVEVTRPWWTTRRIGWVLVPKPDYHCDPILPARFDVALDLRPEAPAVRQVIPERESIHVIANPPVNGPDPGRQLTAWLEADPGVSTEIDWESADPAIARVTEDGVLRVPCREGPAETTLVARSRADPGVTAIVRVTVERTWYWECPP